MFVQNQLNRPNQSNAVDLALLNLYLADGLEKYRYVWFWLIFVKIFFSNYMFIQNDFLVLRYKHFSELT